MCTHVDAFTIQANSPRIDDIGSIMIAHATNE